MVKLYESTAPNHGEAMSAEPTRDELKTLHLRLQGMILEELDLLRKIVTQLDDLRSEVSRVEADLDVKVKQFRELGEKLV